MLLSSYTYGTSFVWGGGGGGLGSWGLLPEYFHNSLPKNQVLLPENNINIMPENGQGGGCSPNSQVPHPLPHAHMIEL